MTFFLEILQDAFFGGVAGIGFASISNPPKNAYKYCFIISAVGHGTRFILMNNEYHRLGLVVASFIAALTIALIQFWNKCRIISELMQYIMLKAS